MKLDELIYLLDQYKTNHKTNPDVKVSINDKKYDLAAIENNFKGHDSSDLELIASKEQYRAI